MSETTQQEKTTQLVSRNETTQLCTAVNRLQPPTTPTTACNRLQPPATAYNRLQPPATACTACNRLHRLHRLYSRIGFFYLLTIFPGTYQYRYCSIRFVRYFTTISISHDCVIREDVNDPQPG
ncbi:hypothetical protein TNCV_3073031 [Trichonephila clavipes]|nr:hypothetical protein TNCV_3073031 [Trichonephila clavipes]